MPTTKKMVKDQTTADGNGINKLIIKANCMPPKSGPEIHGIDLPFFMKGPNIKPTGNTWKKSMATTA